MKRYSILLLVAACLLLWMTPHGVYAQGDGDGDGVFDTKDRCPNDPGPASNNGCPLPSQTNNDQPPQPEQPLHPPGDSDGDGTLDEKDQCPLDGGPDWNNGCPTDQTAPQTEPQIVLPTMPTSGECMIATVGQSRVNLRAMPAATAAIIGVLNPADLYPAFATLTNADGIWYLVKTGWASGQVLRTGGSCDLLPGFEFGDVLLNFTDGPGDGLTLNFLPVPGGNPFVNIHPFGSDKVTLNFTKLADDFPDLGFSFFLTPFPGSPGHTPGANPPSPGSDVFDDGFLRSKMGDGSVFILMPPTLQDGDNPLYGILIGLSKPDIDPNHILDGMLLPAVQTGDGSKSYGILIGLLVPAVQTGDGSNSYGILIGLLLPAVQTGELDPPSDKIGFNFNGDNNASGGGGGAGKLPKSLQDLLDMGLNFFAPAAGAQDIHFDSPGWGVNIQGIVMPTE